MLIAELKIQTHFLCFVADWCKTNRDCCKELVSCLCFSINSEVFPVLFNSYHEINYILP